MNKKTIVFLLVLALVAVACATDTATEEVAVEEEHDHEDHSTLEEVQERGFLKCGVSGSAVAFSETQADGSVTGIDADSVMQLQQQFLVITAKLNLQRLLLLKDSLLYQLVK